MKRRIIFNDNGQHLDLTNALKDFRKETATLNIVASTDTIFIGSVLPFNHFDVEISSLNTVNSSLQIRYWDGNSWEDVAEIIDGTKTAFNSSATFAKSGTIEFTPSKDYSWAYDDTTNRNGTENITGLGTTIIYEQYWCALSFTNSLTSNVTLNWLGSVYSDDTALKIEYPNIVRSEVSQYVSADDTSYKAHAIHAAKIIEKDLISKNLITSKDQLLCREDLELTSIAKTAEIIFDSLGDDYKDDADKARKKYFSRLNNAFPKVDRNSNAFLDRQENRPIQGRLIR